MSVGKHGWLWRPGQGIRRRDESRQPDIGPATVYGARRGAYARGASPAEQPAPAAPPADWPQETPAKRDRADGNSRRVTWPRRSI